MSTVAALVVTFNSDDSLPCLLASLTAQCEAVILVDNGSSNALWIAERAKEYGCIFVGLEKNAGIAAAQNIGIAHARTLGADFLLLSDDDSLPPSTCVFSLCEALEAHPFLAAVGPLPVEEREGGDELVYQARRWGPRRASAQELATDLLDVPFLIASGCLIRLSALEKIGQMDASLFIDHVDLEWGLRAREAGFSLACVPSVRLPHSLGEEVVRLPGREQPIHLHSPQRTYYLARNTVHLIRGSLLPWTWRFGYLIWLAKYATFNSLLAPESRTRARFICRGIADGLRGRMGAAPHRATSRGLTE